MLTRLTNHVIWLILKILFDFKKINPPLGDKTRDEYFCNITIRRIYFKGLKNSYVIG